MSGLAALKARAGRVCTSTGRERVGSMRKQGWKGRAGLPAVAGAVHAAHWCAAGRGAGHSVAPKATPARLHKPMPGAADDGAPAVQAVHDHPFYSRPTLRKYSGEKRPLKGYCSIFDSH